ncbi:MAG: helix-turn-helix domain-containing protein [Faecousia sp.]
MIQNLNQIALKNFGVVHPERAQSADPYPRDSALVIHPAGSELMLYRTVESTWISSTGGMAVLSICDYEDHYLHYYLDKTVQLNADVRFALSTFQGEVSVQIYSRVPPVPLGTGPDRDTQLTSKVRIDRIFTFFYQEKEQGFLFPGESHPMPELTYVDQGELHSVVDGQDLKLKQGDLVIYGPNQWHMQYADIGIAPRFVTISFDVDGVELAPLLDRKFTAPQQVANLLQNMLREQEKMDGLSSDIIVSQLTLLLLYLLRESVQPTGSKVKNANVVQNENEIIRQAQQYVAAHIREKLSVPMVANQVGVSASYLTVLFHKNLQISPGEYIRRIKLQESKQMIRENNLNFTQIASALQYSTVHHFSRQFKEKFGITPTEYAKSVR